jgi:hypothetical protein
MWMEQAEDSEKSENRTKEKNTTFTTRRKFEIKKAKVVGNPFFLTVVFPCMLIITQLLFQQNALVFLLLKAQDITVCTFCLFILSPYMFQPAWVIFRGRNVSA